MARKNITPAERRQTLDAFVLEVGETVAEPQAWTSTPIFPTTDEAAPDRLKRLIKAESEAITRGMQRVREAEQRRRVFVFYAQNIFCPHPTPLNTNNAAALHRG